eukprot:gene9878-7076_t
MGNGLMHSLATNLGGASAHSVSGGASTISPQIDSICSIFSAQPEVRSLFLAFLRKGDWIPSLVETVSQQPTQPQGFTNPEYILPSGSKLAVLDEHVNLYRSRSNSRSRTNSCQRVGTTTRSVSISCSLSVSSMHSTSSHNDTKEKSQSKAKTAAYQEKEQDVRSYMSVDKVLLLVIAAVIPVFLRSKEYAHWQQKPQDSGLATEVSPIETDCQSSTDAVSTSGSVAPPVTTAAAVAPPSKPFVGSRSRASSAGEHAATSPRVNETESLNDLLALTRTAPELVDTIVPSMASSQWLEDLFQYLDNFPYAISVAALPRTDDKAAAVPFDPQQLEITFVNKAFEDLARVSRGAVVRKPFVSTLFSSSVTEPAQVDRLVKAVREAVPCKLGITTAMGDRAPTAKPHAHHSNAPSSFFNLLSVKPVVAPADRRSSPTDVQYVVAVHYNLAGHEEVFSDDLMAVDSVLVLLSALLA